MEKARQHPALTVCAAALALSPSLGRADSVLPSGFVATAHDVLIEMQPGGENWLVLRYLMPAIAGSGVDYSDVVEDLDHLCRTDGLPHVQSERAQISQIVVVLMDRPVIRGSVDAEATQYVGAYLPIAGECVWD